MRSGRTAESEKSIFGFRIRDLTRKQWIILLLVGLLLAVAAWPVPDDMSKPGNFAAIPDECKEYTDQSVLERKVEFLLESVEGVGEASVLLMTGQKESAQGFYASEESIVTGVLIAAEGADQPVVVQNIQQAVMALFQIEAHKIKVMKMK